MCFRINQVFFVHMLINSVQNMYTRVLTLSKAWFPYSHRRSAAARITAGTNHRRHESPPARITAGTNHRRHESPPVAAQSRLHVYFSTLSAASAARCMETRLNVCGLLIRVCACTDNLGIERISSSLNVSWQYVTTPEGITFLQIGLSS